MIKFVGACETSVKTAAIEFFKKIIGAHIGIIAIKVRRFAINPIASRLLLAALDASAPF